MLPFQFLILPFSGLNRKIARVSLLLFFISLSIPGLAQTFVSKKDGNWNAASTWRTEAECATNPSKNTPPFSKDWGCPVDIILQNNVRFANSINNFGNGLVNGLKILSGASLTVEGDFVFPDHGSGTIPYLQMEEGAILDVAGTLNLGRQMNVVIPKNTVVTVENLVLGANSPTITIEAGAQLIVLNQTLLKPGSTLNIKGSLSTRTLVNDNGHFNGSGSGNIQIEADLVSKSGKFQISESFNINAEGDLLTSGSTAFSAEGDAEISVEGDLKLVGGFSAREFVFSGNSKFMTGGNLDISGSVSLTFDQSAVGKIGKNISMVEGASIHLENQSDFRSGGDLYLTGGVLLEISGDAGALIGGNVTMPNGKINASGRSNLFIDGRFTASGGAQVQARQDSKISICDYPNSTQLGTRFIIQESNAFYGAGCMILPVAWSAFDVGYRADNRSNLLTWSTTEENDNNRFEIERSIAGVEKFEKIGDTAGKTWSNSVSAYSFEDMVLPTKQGYVYYRIKQIDTDGLFSYSKTISIKNHPVQMTEIKWKVFPNPTSGDNLSLVLSGTEQSLNEPMGIRVFSASYVSLAKKVNYGLDLNLALSHAVKEAPKGMVIIELVYEGKVSHVKLLKH